MTVELNIHLTDLETGKSSELTHWSSYEVIDDLMNPVSTFRATLAATQYQRELTACGGQKAQVFSYGALQATAIVDERSEATNLGATDLQISGRGVGSFLQDSVVASNRLSLRNRTLGQVADDITQPWQPDWITSVTASNAANRYLISGAKPRYATKSNFVETDDPAKPYKEVKTRVFVKGTHKKFGKNSEVYRGVETDSLKQSRIDPEETVWGVVDKYAKQIASHAFVGADGSLVITRPSYGLDPSVYGQGIVQLWDRKRFKATGGNVMTSQYETSIATRASELVAWATVKSKKTSKGKGLNQGWSVKDPGPAFWARTASGGLGANKLHRPRRVVLRTLYNEKLVKRIVRSMFEQAVIEAFSLEYQLRDHTINGVLPVVDSMINVYDERYNLVGPYYIVRVERKLDMGTGRVTVLKLIPPKIWLYFDHDTTSDQEYEEHMIDNVFW